MARFLREARLGAQLEHPNLVAVTDAGEFEGVPYLAMELVDGTTLANLLWKGGRLAPNLLLDLGRQLAAGVDALHEADLVHRDLKPANVMVTRQGVVKIADLGLVGGAALDTLTRTGTVVGTPRFMAPEQVRQGYTSAASDLFAVGLMLYLALTGRDPYERTKDTPLGETLQRLFQEDPRPWHPRREDGPLDRVFRAALSRDPAGRPRTGRALIEALAAALEKERAGGAAAVQDPSTDLLTVDPTDTLEILASQAPQLPKELEEMPDEPSSPLEGATEDAPAPVPPPMTRRSLGLWLALGLGGALVGALVLPKRGTPRVTAWAIVGGDDQAALVFHTDREARLEGGPEEPTTAHVVPWSAGTPGPRTRSGAPLFPEAPGATTEALGTWSLAYDDEGGIRLSFPRPTLGALRLVSGPQTWRPLTQDEGEATRLVFHLPGGDLPDSLSVQLEAGGRGVELARLVPPPPAREAREVALIQLAAWDPRELLEPAVHGETEEVGARLLEHPTMQGYLQIESNLLHAMAREPNTNPPGLDRVLLVHSFLSYAGLSSPIRLARSPVRYRIWRPGFYSTSPPPYPGVQTFQGQASLFSYDFSGEVGDHSDPTFLLGRHFGTKPLKAEDLPPGPCWLEVYASNWRDATYAVVWIGEAGPFFLAEQPREDPAADLALHIARHGGPWENRDPHHRALRLRLPEGLVKPENPLVGIVRNPNQLRLELRSWGRPGRLFSPWAMVHGYGVRPLDAVPLPPELERDSR
jgi:hypothetical protein